MVLGKKCPRCGQIFSYLEKRKKGNREYLYAVHVNREKGKRRIKKCYLGSPERAPHLTPHLTPQEAPQSISWLMEKIELSEEDYLAIMLYYGKRVKCPENVRNRARELFNRIFSKGEKILIVK